MTNTENQDALAEIKEKFEGYWKVDRSEHFEDFLREVGKFVYTSIYVHFTAVKSIVVNNTRLAVFHYAWIDIIDSLV